MSLPIDWGVPLGGHGPDASHGSTKVKNIMIRHNTSHDMDEFDTHAIDEVKNFEMP